MKTIRKALKIIAAVSMIAVVFLGCKDNNGGNEPTALNVESMEVGGSDLNAAESPTDVPVDASIEIKFNSEIQSGTATSDNITLTQDYNDTDIPLEISVDGPVLTVTPESNLGNGILYQFEINGLLNVDEQPLGQTQRSFTTVGTFSPPGIIAHWTFEDSPDDVVGDYDPTSNGVVDITYASSRNDAAGKAAEFNGNTSIIEIPNADPLIETSDFTINFWVKTNSEGHVNENGDPTGHFVMGLGAHMGLQFEVFSNYEGAKFAIQYEHSEGSDSEDMWFPAEATDNTNGGWQGWDYAKSISPSEMQDYLKDNWLHVTYTYDGDERKGKLYYDGELMKSLDFDLWPEEDPKSTVTGMTYAGQEPDVVNDLAFGFIQSREGTMWDNEPWGGYDYETSQHFKGMLDDIKIYHKVLTETEIQLMYDSEK